MNGVYRIAFSTLLKSHHQRPNQRLRDKTETMFRDLAYVLQLTRRVREEILEEREEVVGV